MLLVNGIKLVLNPYGGQGGPPTGNKALFVADSETGRRYASSAVFERKKY